MAKLKAATRNQLPSSAFGLPKQRKYSMEDRPHRPAHSIITAPLEPLHKRSSGGEMTPPLPTPV